jgi:hypothetical protein
VNFSARQLQKEEEGMKLNTFKISHSILLVVVFILLMDPKSFFGIWFHEIAGLTVCALFILHMVLNWTWIKVSTKRLFGKINGKQRLKYIIDILLLVAFACILISGMAIAKKIDFSWLGFDMSHRMIYRSMHASFSMLVLVITGIHLGLHWNWVVARFKRSK